MPVKILYISHSSSFSGGAILSLLGILNKLDRGVYEPVVASIFDIPDFFHLIRKMGIEANYWPGIYTVSHTTGGWHSALNPLGWVGIAKMMVKFYSSISATYRLIDFVKPDLIHLNSVILIPSAIACRKAGVKLVWHIRESVVRGHFGIRKRWIARKVSNLADKAIFISDHDKRLLCPNCGAEVIANFVDFKHFDRKIDGHLVRVELGIPKDSKVILFLGGISKLKGAPVLLEAIRIAEKHVPHIKAIFAGAIRPMSNTYAARIGRILLPLLGRPTERQTFFRFLKHFKLNQRIILLPFRYDVERLIAASDLAVFPSTQPHFARPVVEAGAMAKPVVASRIGGVEELVEDGITGILVPHSNPAALADAMSRILLDDKLAKKMGEKAYMRAENLYNSDVGISRIIDIYKNLLGKHELNCL